MQLYLVFIWDYWTEWRSLVGVFTNAEDGAKMGGIVIDRAIEDFKNSPFGVGTESNNYEGIEERFDLEVVEADINSLIQDEMGSVIY